MAKRSQSWQSLPSPLSLLTLTIAALFVEPATGQCTTQWLPGPAFAGTDLTVHATAEWDPDGAGPDGSLVVAGGDFTVAGSVVANRVAAYDPSTVTWRSLGQGMNDSVRALAVLPGGDLVAAGRFTLADGSPANRIARWDGTSWLPLGAGVSGDVLALAVLPNGDLVAAGSFTSAGSTSANRIARWNGITWASLSSGLDGSVRALAVLPNGQLVAGGEFTMAGGVPANKVALWNGATWSPLGSFAASSIVDSVLAMPNGDVFAGGTWLGPGSSARAWRWDGTSWSNTWSFQGFSVQALALLPNGDVAASAGSSVVQWNGISWATIGTSGALALKTLANGNLVAVGGPGNFNGVIVDCIAIWDGANWWPAGPSPAGPLSTHAFTALPNGDVVTGTRFAAATLTSAVVRWTGASWTLVGGSFNGGIAATALLPNGNLVAGGYFGIGTPNYIAVWNGTNWLPLGSGADFYVLALAVMPNGDLVAGGDFQTAGGVPASRIARWDGTTWSALGNGLGGSVMALAVFPNGDIVAGGNLGGATNVARWDGVTWTPLGTMIGEVYALAVMPNGDIVAGGRPTQASGVAVQGIARWNGVSWSPLGAGLSYPVSPAVTSLVVLPNGDLVACGLFDRAGGAPAHGIARWNGASWLPLATSAAASAGTGYATGPFAMCLLPNGDLAVGGSVSVMNGVVSARMARLTPTCPAAAVISGTGCTGSGGPNVLTATALPWLGSTFRANATGLPANALAMSVFGTTTAAIPLAAISPQGTAGCSLLVSPDVLSLLLSSGVTAQVAFAIPNTPSLVGAVFHEQVVPIELNASGGIVALTATNRLTLTIGTY